MDIAIEYLFLFCLCATAGWGIEVVYRGVRHRKVVNPGFLTGPCLPLYGTGGAILYFLSGLKLRALPAEWLRVAVILLLSMAVMTLIELIGGLISVKYFHVRLWDYSDQWLNFKGLICPKFSLFWGIICALYFFFLYPVFHRLATRMFDYPWALLLLGMYFGIFLVDLEHSVRLLGRVRKYARDLRTRICLDQLKGDAKDYFKSRMGRKHGTFNFHRMINRYMREHWEEKK